MRDVIVGTAGHIDHGKTALVRALTGIDTDRLEEEKRRGITIDIGFAHLDLGPYRVGFVDVPGHEKFVKNMLAGIGGIDVALLVVAATESVMPQTVEHFEICRLLEIPRGLIAITKKDQADPDLLELVRDEVADLVRGSFLEGAPVVAVDSLSGDGIAELKDALLAVVDTFAGCRRATEDFVFRLPIDRVFTIRGFGTVVTGTPGQGRLEREAAVAVYPSGRTGKVRGIEIFNRPTEIAEAGQRTALNLTGLEKQDLERGMVISRPGVFDPSYMLDVMLQVLPEVERSLGHRSPIRFHHGSAELVGRVYLLGRSELQGGESAPVQIRLDTPTVACPGDHFIVRSYSPATTIGGGIVLDNAPGKHSHKDVQSVVSALSTIAAEFRNSAVLQACSSKVLDYIISCRGADGADLRHLVARTGSNGAAVLRDLKHLDSVILVPQDPPLAVAKAVLDELQEKMAETVVDHLKANPLSPGISREELKTRFLPRAGQPYFQYVLDALAAAHRIQISGGHVLPYGTQTELTEAQKGIRDEIVRRISDSAYQPPTLEEIQAESPHPPGDVRDVFHFLLKRGELVRISSDIVLLPAQLDWLKDQVKNKFPRGQAFVVADFKEIVNVSRKYAIPYLEYLDRERVTRRAGDKRIVL